jgi:hypothetical protein
VAVEPSEPEAHGLSPAQRTLRARIGAHKLHASRDSRELTAPARAAFLDKFRRQADPESKLPVAERERRALQLRKAYYAQLAFRSSKARTKKRTSRDVPAA